MTLFEFIYFLGYSAKKHYSLRRQKRLPHKVISIGNITAGGTGKTPAVIAIAEEAKKRGFCPVILTRGYKGKAKGPCFVQRSAVSSQQSGVKNQEITNASRFTLHASRLYGDEPLLMAERLPDVPVVKCVSRYEGGMFAIENLNSQIPNFKSQIIFILDDGYQHWRLFRDRNVLLIDSENPFDNRRLLPVGLLREPVKEIKRADIIIITKAQFLDDFERFRVENLVKEIRNYNSDARIFFSGHKPVRIIGTTGITMPLRWAKDKGFFAFCGIGSPDSFKKTLKSIGCEIKGFKAYRDHYRYKQSDIEVILKEAEKQDAEWIITTEKDMTRLKGLTVPDSIVSLSVEFAVDNKFYEEVFRF